ETVQDERVGVDVPTDADCAPRAVRPGNAHVLVLRAQASSATAARRIAPAKTFWYSGFTLSRLKPLRIICRKNAPRTARQIAPSPPRIETPPSTTAVIASKVYPALPMSAWAVEVCETMMIPAIPPDSPEMAKVVVLTRSTRTPESRAASALPP